MTFQADMQLCMNAMVAAYRAGDAKSCAGIFVEDALLSSPYAHPARGRAAIEALHRDWTQGFTGKDQKVLDAARSGDMGWCLVAHSEGDSSGVGASLSVMELQPDGHWRIRMCSLNSDAPPLLE